MPSKKIRRRRWTDQDIALLREMYGKSPKYLVMASLPGRTWPQINDAAHRFGLSIPKPGRLSRGEVLKRKREGMRRQRENPEKRDEINTRNRDRYRNSVEVRAAHRRNAVAWRERHFFAYKIRFLDGVSAKDLWSLWKKQRGRCALTGRKLDRTAHLDHKLPKSRGGQSTLDNLQWLCSDANYLKRHMTNKEFLSLCRDVIAWVSAGIPLADNPQLRLAFPNPIDSNKARWNGRRIADQTGAINGDLRRIEMFEGLKK
jgi:5-methylcytosine-specific restriction endonuclease McrA